MSKPLVSLGLPVYNSQAELFRQTIKDLLSQSFGDFEIIISDNASDEERRALYEDAAALDRCRIRYVRHNANRGAVFNFQYVADVAAADLFSWVADDDRHGTRFLHEGIAAMRSGVCSVAYGAFIIDPNGARIRSAAMDVARMTSRLPARRMLALLARDYNLAIYGLHRTEVVRRIRIKPSIFADYHMMISLLALGRWSFVDEELFGYRVDPAKESMREAQHGVMPSQTKYSDAARSFMAEALEATEYMSATDRIQCIAAVAAIVAWQGWWTLDTFHREIVRLRTAVQHHQPRAILHAAKVLAASPTYPLRKLRTIF